MSIINVNGTSIGRHSLDNTANSATTKTPYTRLGRKLVELRAEIIASGESLLNWNDLECEIVERRGENEANLY